MHSPTLLTLLTLLITTTLSSPNQTIQKHHILTETHRLPPRQQAQNIPQLLSLASIAGITLPTDPAALLSLGPVAASLQSYLPTPSVLSVLQSAAPPDFISKVVHDTAYAASFEEAFAKGSSPSWFLALPTEVKSYLHTYSGYGGVATAVGDFESVNRGARTRSTTSMSGSTTTASTSGSATSASASAASANAQSTGPAKQPASAAVKSTAPLTLALTGAMVVGALAVML
ncbi:MAG: hypothetical protein Q9182_002602 [Xanthomendoza sp. 2 TL-2023]